METIEVIETPAGWNLSAGQGRKKLTAEVRYSAKLNRYVLAGDLNRRTIFQKSAIKAFKKFAKNPDKYDRGKPPTVGETCMPLPPGIDPLTLLEAPRCKTRWARPRAIEWYKAQCRKARTHA